VQGGYGACFCSHGTKLVEHNECRGTKLNASHIFITVYKFDEMQWRGPDLSPVTKLSWLQEQIAKTVTSNLPLLSVLGGRSILLIVKLIFSSKVACQEEILILNPVYYCLMKAKSLEFFLTSFFPTKEANQNSY